MKQDLDRVKSSCSSSCFVSHSPLYVFFIKTMALELWIVVGLFSIIISVEVMVLQCLNEQMNLNVNNNILLRGRKPSSSPCIFLQSSCPRAK